MRLFLLPTVLLLSSVLFGCGGSSSSSGSGTSGSTTTTLEFTISGTTTDIGLAGGEVTVFIDDEDFSATAEDDGSYSLTIEYEDDDFDGDEMVLLQAEGDGSQDHIEYFSWLGTFAEVMSQAGSDDELTQSELSRTALTQVTTAMYLLSQDTGIDIDDDDSLAEAETAVNAETLADLSALIKILSDYEDYEPSKNSVVDNLIGDSDTVTAMEDYLIDIEVMDDDGELTDDFAELMTEALVAVIDDSNVIQAFSESDATGTHIATVPVTSGWVANTDGSDVFNLSSDGSGTVNISYYDSVMSDDVSDEAVDWSLTDSGKLMLDYTDEISTSTEFYDEIAITYYWGESVSEAMFDSSFVGDYFTVTTQYSDPEITKIYDDKVVIEYSLRTVLDPTDYVPDWEGDYPYYEESYIEVRTWHQANQIDAIWSAEPSGTWVLPIVREYQEYSASEADEYLVPAIVVLDVDYSVYDTDGENFGTWSYSDGVLTIVDDNDWTVSIEPFDSSSDLYSAVITASYDEQQISQVHWLAEADQENASLEDDLVQDLPNILASWPTTWKDSESGDFENIAGYLLADDTNVKRITAYDDYHYDDETDSYIGAFIEDSYYYSSWQNLADYQWMLTGSTDYSDTLAVTRERTWTAITTQSDDSHIVLEQEYYQFSGDDADSYNDGYVILPRLNVLSSYDLSEDYDDEYQLSLDEGYLTTSSLASSTVALSGSIAEMTVND